jgi:YfiH family protein
MYKFFSQHEEVIAGMSTKEDGNMKVKGEHSDVRALQNRKNFCKKNGINYENLVSACVEHTTNVAVIDNEGPEFIDNTDALVTNNKDLYLSITNADCFPVLMFDRKNDVIGIAHAGWRGIVKDIIPRTLNVMLGEGAQLEEIKLTVGPGISQEYFDFEFNDLISEFGFYNQDKYILEGSTIEKVKVDLRQIIFDQSNVFGIKEENMHDCGECTFAHDNMFFSARRDGDDFGVMMSIIGMQPKKSQT